MENLITSLCILYAQCLRTFQIGKPRLIKSRHLKRGNLDGSIEAADEGSVLVSSEGARMHYRIPKHLVEGFDGHAVSLKVAKTELDQYRADRREGFGKVK